MGVGVITPQPTTKPSAPRSSHTCALRCKALLVECDPTASRNRAQRLHALPIRQSHACWIVSAGAPFGQPFTLARPQSCSAEDAKLRHELLVVPVHVAIDAYHSRSSAYRPFVGMPCFLAETRSACSA